MKKLPFLLLLPALAATTQLATATSPALTAATLPAAYPLAERQPRPVAPFTGVSADGSMRVVLRQGSPQRVEVEASAADQAKVETEVKSGSLHVGRRREGGMFSSAERFEGPVTVYVTAPTLTALGVAGSGDLSVEGPVQAGDFRVSVAGSGNLSLPQLTAQTLKTSVAGSGNVTLGGSCGQHQLSIQGSGGVNATNLRTDDTRVSISGSGNARVNAAKTLSSSIAGSGDVLYSGSPQVSSSKAGSGSVKRL